jgi:hypothetical protein
VEWVLLRVLPLPPRVWKLGSVEPTCESQAHVNKDKVYHCPGQGCPREFSRLASLSNHLESESCGAVKFESVQRNVEGFLTGKRLIGFG